MNEVRLTRDFNVDIETVFDFVTRAENQAKWWGPEGMTIVDHQLDFTKLGPWHAIMQNADGDQFHVAGEVLEVSHPCKIRFTWGWIEHNDVPRGKSEVCFTLEAMTPKTTKFSLHHYGFETVDDADGHARGWTSTLSKLTKQLNKGN